MTTQPKNLVEGTEISLYNQATWNRATVADGKWLQNETLEPISANDRILASAINYVSGGVDDLTYRIDLLEDASDVINVYGTWTDFVTHSGELFDSSAITNNDIIKVLNDPNQYPDLTADGGHQTYFRWSADNGSIWPLDPTEGQWEYIGYIEPYYNKNEVDTIIDDLSATVKDEYVPWTATDCPIGDKNIANNYSLAQGSANSASYDSFAQGSKNKATYNSVAIGKSNSADNQSFAVGINNIGTSEGFSHGDSNESNGDSLAQGIGNSATTRSLAQGYYNYADYYSLAQGKSNKAETYSLAQGEANSADRYAVAFGLNNNASQTSITQGDANTASYQSIAIGNTNSAYLCSVAMGSTNAASTYSQAFGKGIIITNTAMSIGSYNKTSADIAFVIGNGTDNDNRSDLFLINKNGDTTSIGAAYFTGFSGINISGLTQTASIDNLINSAANGGGMTAVKSISGFTIDNSTGPTQEIELQSSADHLNIALSGSIKNSITLYGQQDTYGNHYLYIQGTQLLKTADFDDWASSTASVFSGTSRSAIYAYSAQSAYSAQKAGSAAIAYSATSAHNAEYLGAKLPSAYMQVANIGRDANGNISSYGGSAIAGLGDYVPKSATDCPIGSNNTAVNIAFAQGTTNSADTTAFAQGDSNKSSFESFAQGNANTAANYSLAQGWQSSAERHSMTQGVSNTAYNLSFAQGDLNFADGLSLAQGEETLARWGSIAQGSGTSATNRSQAFGEGTVANASGMAIGTYNKTYDAAFIIGNGTKTNQSTNRSDLLVIDHSGNMIITAAYPNKHCSATYSPSGIHLDDSVQYGYDVYLTNEGVFTTGYDGSTSIPFSARWLDIIDPRKNYVSAMGELPIVISAVTNLPPTLQEGIYYLV